ncbi:HD domain-containing protein [Persephonella sp.]
MLKVLKKKSKKYPLKSGKVYVGAGLDLLKGDIGRIYWEKPHYQAIVFGGAGSGKSELISRWTYEAILDDKQVFNIDPKGSKSWLESFFKACYRKGTLYDKQKGPIVLTLPYPEISVKFNPLYGMTAHQKAATIASGIPEGKEPFFKNIAYEIVLTASLGLEARGVEEIILSDIYKYLKVETLQELRTKVLEDTVANPELRRQAEDALMTLDNIAQYDPQYFPRVNSSLRTYLTRLITGNAGEILNVRAGNILWERLDEGNLKFFAFLNAEAEMQIAYDVGRLLFANLLAYVGQQSRQLKVIEPQLRVIVDEATEVGFAELNKAIRLVRERNVSVSIFTQSPSGFASAFGKEGQKMVTDIVNSCDLRIAFRMAAAEDREYMVKMSPDVAKGQLMLHQSSLNLYYKEDKLLKPFDFEELDPGFGYAFLDKTVYYFYTPLTTKYDPLTCKVVFTDKPEEVKADVVVNLKKVSESYPQVEREHYTLETPQVNTAAGKQTHKPQQPQEPQTDMLIVVMSQIKKNYERLIDKDFTDTEIISFYEQVKNFFLIYRNDLNKILGVFDLIKTSVKSIVKGDNPLKNISLLDHSLRVALNAYEEIKDIEDLTQEEKEIVVLASLAHDIGKAFANQKAYDTKDHIRNTERILQQLKVNKKIIAIAVHHHDKPEVLGELGKLLKYVKRADYQARQTEAQIVQETIDKELLSKIDIKRLNNTIRNHTNTDFPVVSNEDGTVVYVEKDTIHKMIKNNMKGEKVNLTDDHVLKILPNSTWVKLKFTLKNTGELVKDGVYLKLPLQVPLNKVILNKKKSNPSLKSVVINEEVL